MPIFPPRGLAEQIVHLLRLGPLETSILIKRLQRSKTPATLQGIYKALRALRSQGVVFMQHQEATLNLHWLQELETFVRIAEHAHKDLQASSGHFLQLQDGDRITYVFKNPLQVDAFWSHVLYILFEALPKLDRWYAHASHCWFLLGRRDEELALRDYMIKRGIKYHFTVGHQTPLDRHLKHDFDNNVSQYVLLDQPLFKERPNHLDLVINVIGDYIIEARYDKQTTDRIEHFYETTTRFTKEKQAEFETILKIPSRITLVIIRNQRKADRLAALLGKHFI